MSNDLTVGIVRILNPAGITAGTGFVVTGDGLIATCAHVVESAGAGPEDSVRVAFHASGEEREAQVEPTWWRSPDAEDVAILRLDGSLPEGVEPLRLGSSGASKGHEFNSRGYRLAEYFPQGLEAEGKIQAADVEYKGYLVLQLLTNQIDEGMSGAPIWDVQRRRVVGMVNFFWETRRHIDAWLAFATPTETLRAVCPDLRLSDVCPYQGLAAFTEDHAEFFFGREKLVADLVDHLRANPRFLAVVGPSGSGKSSVVRAGLFPVLRRGDVPGSGEWHLLSFRPGDDPFAALTTAGLDVSQDGDLPAAVRAFLETHPQVKRLVLFADQFEELFTLCPQPVREQFLRQLAALLEGNLSVTLVLTLRADFYGHLLRYAPLVDWLKIGQVNVPPMGLDELRAAVEEPALRLGLRFEPGLVETIVEEASAADHPLPLLESAMTQLWKRREDGILIHAAYQAVGRVAGAIGQWAEDAYAELAPEDRLLARRVFTRLVRYGEGEVADTRQQQSLSELVTRPEEREPLHQLVQRLADARLLVTGGDPGAEAVEIIHDALLQQWGRLKHWTAEQREFYLWRQRLDERLHEWEEKGQDEGALLRGALLTEAERWLVERSDDLNLDEQPYIRESVALREQEQMARERLRQRIILGLTGGLLVALVLAVAAGLGWQSSAINEKIFATEAALHATARADAEMAATAEAEARQVAVARQLAAQAQTEMESSSPTLGTLLAVESIQHWLEVKEASFLGGDQALRAGLRLLPRRLGPMRHMTGYAFSPDGRWIATGRDNTIWIWEAASSEKTVSLIHDTAASIQVFSPDGHLLVTQTDDAFWVWRVVTGQKVIQMIFDRPAGHIGFSPDGHLLVRISGSLVWVWEVTTWRQIAEIQHDAEITCSAFSPDGRWMATGNLNHIAQIWDLNTGREIARIEHKEKVVDVSFSVDGRWIASGSYNPHNLSGDMVVWEAATGEEIIREECRPGSVFFSTDGRWVTSNGARVWEMVTRQDIITMLPGDVGKTVGFSQDGRWLVTVNENHTLRVWKVATRTEVVRLTLRDWVSEVVFSLDGERLAVVTGDDATVLVFGLPDGQEMVRLDHGQGADQRVEEVVFSPDGHWLATRSGYVDVLGGFRRIRVWEVSTGSELARIDHDGQVQYMEFSPNSRWLATDGGGISWISDIPSTQEIAQLVHRGQVIISPNGRWLATTNGNTTLVQEISTWQQVAQIDHDDNTFPAALDPNGKWLAMLAKEAGYVDIWDSSTGQMIGHIELEDSTADAVFSPDGFLLATGGAWRGDSFLIWETGTWSRHSRLVVDAESPGSAMVFNPDGSRFAAGCLSGLVKVWKTDNWQEVSQMQHDNAVLSMVVSPDGTLLLTGTSGGIARLWEMNTGRSLMELSHPGYVNAVAFSSDGRWFATAGSDGRVRVWATTSNQEVARVDSGDYLRTVAFTPSGQQFITVGDNPSIANDDPAVRLWTLWSRDLVIEACARLPRNLTREEWEMYLPDEPYRPTCPNLPVPEE